MHDTTSRYLGLVHGATRKTTFLFNILFKNISNPGFNGETAASQNGQKSNFNDLERFDWLSATPIWVTARASDAHPGGEIAVLVALL